MVAMAMSDGFGVAEDVENTMRQNPICSIFATKIGPITVSMASLIVGGGILLFGGKKRWWGLAPIGVGLGGTYLCAYQAFDQLFPKYLQNPSLLKQGYNDY